MVTPESSEQPREFPRYEVNAYVDFTGNEVLLFHRIQNISLGGVCIQTSGVEEVGTVVDLVLNFPDLDASIAVRGEVVWANRDPPMDMGIRYVEMDDERKDTLRKYISMVRK
ncbi:MAG TPA: PilZ domain-containing protein [Polyangia bacterium]|nr:PilZ domain-containing protein [Polyangia bacterium]